IPLHVHSQYSILNALPSLESLVQTATHHKMNALALTDSGNLIGAVEFYQLCQKQAIKPILGIYIHLTQSRLEKRKQSRSFPILLLAKDNVGYKNLCKIGTKAYLEGFYYRPRVDWELLKEYKEGLICISGFLHSHLANAILDKSALEKEAAIDQYQTL